MYEAYRALMIELQIRRRYFNRAAMEDWLATLKVKPRRRFGPGVYTSNLAQHGAVHTPVHSNENVPRTHAAEKKTAGYECKPNQPNGVHASGEPFRRRGIISRRCFN